MKSILTPWVVSLILAAPVSAQVQVNSLTAFMPDVDGATDAALINDHLSPNSYESYVGELVLMPTDAAFLSSVAANAPGLIYGDAGGAYSGKRGLAGFCVDYNTSFQLSNTSATTYNYVPLNYADANARYNSEGVSGYLNGGLKRAAYLLDQHYDAAHAAGDDEVAALQAAIWEVLYDASPSVSMNAGNYYVHTNSLDANLNLRGQAVIGIANPWLTAAVNANWGGAGYNPDGRVIFWLDPNATNLNQSIITLNPFLVPVPEPSVCTLLAGFGILLLRRRRP